MHESAVAVCSPLCLVWSLVSLSFLVWCSQVVLFPSSCFFLEFLFWLVSRLQVPGWLCLRVEWVVLVHAVPGVAVQVGLWGRFQ
jgi:hypothetical protein